ncbi:MAG: alpha/beta fold hydrolase [Methylococcales symbiont of Iophon sp. n. MRB-2018]|nr:MAG: alpha/beta fold hydrolase [Methylococcales symbiont of Iophon sp. n. MRB-2018]KAF3979066.1 MAG: alpha/beta fold hydrolase [Methylococcales symbiont of Iophon sp. n. MRB-2018]
MNETVDYDDFKDIDIKMYDWSVKFIRSLTKKLKVNMQLHADQHGLQGDIFLFNHFSRFETFIPQFLIHEKTGDYCCSIASGEFFTHGGLLATYLNNVGVIPHDHQRLFANLARQIFLGKKVIIFPEGGMVKDHQVLDKHGNYSIYSRITGERRKQHTGAAVLAQGIEVFKTIIRTAYIKKDRAQLIHWKEELKLDSLDRLLTVALKPTLIVPSNITFYPIRASDNLLLKGVELFTDGLTVRQTEELLIEGNILLKDTDMDLRMGKPIDSYDSWSWMSRYLLSKATTEIKSLDDIFSLNTKPKSIKHKLLGYCFKKNVKINRNQYMKEIYANVTINLSHLASVLIIYCLNRGQQKISKKQFNTTLYIAIKTLQKHFAINLHNSLLNPDEYRGLISGDCKRFAQFIQMAEKSELIISTDEEYQFQAKLGDEFDFDEIRMENLIIVYVNEVEPIKEVKHAVIKAVKSYDEVNHKSLSVWAMDDESVSLRWDKQQYSDVSYDDINQQETASANPESFLLQPTTSNGIGALLIHGLLSSPAELRDYAEELLSHGYTVLVIRLKGHGTSPYDLRDQAAQDWYDSIPRGLDILSAYCNSIVIIGFSTGGGLALKLAATNDTRVCAVVAVAVPIEFVAKSFLFIPFLHGTNRLVKWVSSVEGVKPFIENSPEHPTVNYRHVPVKSLYELRRLMDDIESLLHKVQIPVLIVYADEDPVVHPDSARLIESKLGSKDKKCIFVHSDRHGILMDNIGGTWDVINTFLEKKVLLA